MGSSMNVMIFLLATLLLVHSAIAKDDIENDISESFASTTASNLDTINLRKALLRALTELENEEIQKDDADVASKTIFFSTTAQTPERIIERASAAAISILAKDTQEATKATTPAPADDEAEQKTEKPIVIIQKSDGVQHRPIISVLNENNEEVNEALSLSASSSFTDDSSKNDFVRSSPKPIGNLNHNAVTVNDKSFTPGVKSVSITPKYDVTVTATTTGRPATTTEESQAKVEDVQFFPAPLVAAFTVHQDERGLPNKVEPIFKQAGQSAVSVSEVADKERQEVLRQEERKRDEFRRRLEAEAKHKALEFQLKTLQEQQKQQQEYLVRQQRIIQDQQLQHQRLLEEQTRLQQNDRPFIPIPNGPSTTERPVFFTTTNNGFADNTFQKAVDINPTIGGFNGGFGQSTPSSLTSPAPPPRFFQELPLTTPSPVFNQNLNHNPNPNINQNQNLNPNLNPTPNRFNNFNNLNLNQNQNQNQNNFNGNFKNTFSTNFNNLNNNNNLNPNNVNQDFNQKLTPGGKFPNTNKFQNTVVSLQTSLSLSPSDLQAGKLPLNAQILPVRNAIDFHQSPNPNTNFNFRPPAPLNQQPQFFPNAFQTLPNNFAPNPYNVHQGTRVFRQESGTGNFGAGTFNSFNANNNFNPHPSFSIQQSLEPPNRFFRANGEQFQNAPGLVNKNAAYQPQNVNQQLDTLLYHSGITRNVRQNDDLHIVSKILSFNLGRDNLFAGSRLREQRVKPQLLN